MIINHTWVSAPQPRHTSNFRHRRHGVAIKVSMGLLAATAGLISPAGESSAQVTVELRETTRNPFLSGSDQLFYTTLGVPTINAAGQTAFRGFLGGDGISFENDTGIWSEAAGSIGSPGLVAREGDAASGTPDGVVYTSFFSVPVLNAAGQTAFRGFLTGDGVDISNDVGLWSEAAGSIGSPGLIARTGNAAPGTEDGTVFSGFFLTEGVRPPAFNDAGQSAFGAFLTGPNVDSENSTGIWSEAAGSIGSPGLVARAGDAAPGTEAGVVYGTLIAPTINAAGETTFRGLLSGSGISDTNDSGIWSEAVGLIGSPGLVAREGDAAPGTSAGVVYSGLFDEPVTNAAGQTAFRSTLAGTGVDETNNSGIWSEAAGSIGSPGLVARIGDAAPGTEPGVVFSQLSQPVINAAGETAFFGVLSGPGVDETNNVGIWSEAAGSIGNPELVVRQGDQAPGTEPGVVFASLGDPFNNTPLSNNTVLNAAGQIAFTAFTFGPDTNLNRGIWVTDLDGELQLVVNGGEVFDVDPNPDYEDFRDLDGISIEMVLSLGRENGLASSFNDAGQLAFRGNLFSPTVQGIFVANTLPSTLLGDYNGDGVVSQADLDLVLLNWGDTVLPDGFDAQAIANGDPFDGLISQNELDGVLLNWGDGNPGSTPPNLNAIPEPAASILLLLLAGPLVTRRSPRPHHG